MPPNRETPRVPKSRLSDFSLRTSGVPDPWNSSSLRPRNLGPYTPPLSYQGVWAPKPSFPRTQELRPLFSAPLDPGVQTFSLLHFGPRHGSPQSYVPSVPLATGQTLTPSLNPARSASVITACSGQGPVPPASLDGRLGLGAPGWAGLPQALPPCPSPHRPCPGPGGQPGNH